MMNQSMYQYNEYYISDVIALFGFFLGKNKHQNLTLPRYALGDIGAKWLVYEAVPVLNPWSRGGL